MVSEHRVLSESLSFSVKDFFVIKFVLHEETFSWNQPFLFRILPFILISFRSRFMFFLGANLYVFGSWLMPNSLSAKSGTYVGGKVVQSFSSTSC